MVLLADRYYSVVNQNIIKKKKLYELSVEKLLVNFYLKQI